MAVRESPVKSSCCDGYGVSASCDGANTGMTHAMKT